MRPLIETLEDERRLMQQLESVYRFMLRDDDPELLLILEAKKEKIDRDLDKVHAELREYVAALFE